MQAGAGPGYVDARKQNGGYRGRHLYSDLLHTDHRSGNGEVQERHFREFSSFRERSGGFFFRCQFQTSRALEAYSQPFFMFWFQMRLS
jgi:hypothetical protein